MAQQQNSFFSSFARVLNSNQSRSVVLCGNVYDLFFNGDDYVPLIPFLCDKTRTNGLIQIVYELNGPIRIQEHQDKLRDAWIAWKSGMDPDDLLVRELRSRGASQAERLAEEFQRLLLDSIGNVTLALEFLRQLTICSRMSRLEEDLLIIIEAADMLLPTGRGDIASLDDRQLRRIAIAQDWFCEPDFMDGSDSVCLVAESSSLIHPRVSRLPQVLDVEIPPPSLQDRRQYIDHFLRRCDGKLKLWGSVDDLASFTAGLSLHALRQLLAGAAYASDPLTAVDVVAKVEAFIQSQIGDDVVEFKKPKHRLENVVGFTRLKSFIKDELLPRFRATDDKALPGAAVAGPIGSGKSFVFEAVAGEMDLPVLVLKSIRSQWFGQTDVIFERLRRTLEALDKVVIFVDEADTQFGGVGPEAHATERRLTGKIQAMMSDPQLRGRVAWLLMTARIHLLSADIRRPGRVGDLIIPVLDPIGEDRAEFIRWTLGGVLNDVSDADVAMLDKVTAGYSAAAFASLRSNLKAKEPTSMDDVIAIATDLIPPAIDATRRYQTLQALLNCTRRSLLPDPRVSDSDRDEWRRESLTLEAMGIH
jgi:hypothetical protein